MASIKNSLRKIYTALGGNNSKSKTITGLLDDISTVASSGGSGGGENNDFIVTFEYDEQEGSTTSDKSLREIINASKEGKNIYGINSRTVGDDVYMEDRFYLSYAAVYGENAYTAVFFNINIQGLITGYKTDGNGDVALWSSLPTNTQQPT